MKYLILTNEEKISEVIDFLIIEDGLPQIQQKLNIYSSTDDIQIEIVNNKIFFGDSSKNKYNFVKNKNLKQFFQFVQSKNNEGFKINDIVLLKFSNINLLFNTFHGHLLVTDNVELEEKLIKTFKLKTYENINNHRPSFTVKSEYLFDKIGNLNSKIKTYANQTGLDIRSASTSMRLRLSNISNDYTHIEKYYKLITKDELLGVDSNSTYQKYFKNISIIIPSYNTNVIKTLLSIQGQNISKENKNKIQVILIDDGSNIKVSESIETIKNKIDYELDIIRFENNLGISSARNAGIAIARYDLLLFMDSDIILSENYLYDINIRLQLVPNAIFVAMRKNIDDDSKFISEENILKGVERTLYSDEKILINLNDNTGVGRIKKTVRI